jgi:hypothetical protein
MCVLMRVRCMHDIIRSAWGAGTRIESGLYPKKQGGRYYWYGDHDVDTLQPGFEFYALELSRQRYQGGVVACSTNDFVSWRNEGTMVSDRLGTATDCL